MTNAICVHQPGGPEAMRYEPVSVAQPGPGEALVRHTAIGVNFIDVYFRKGVYAWPSEGPLIPGAEGVGEVMTVGEGVTAVKPGDRVAHVQRLGAYAEQSVIAADRLVSIPGDVDDETAAAVMLKGLTAHYLLHKTFHVQAHHSILIHAAAGGVGLIAGQWAASLGATVIGTIGSDEKVELARANGYAHVINYRQTDFVERVKEITEGKGVDAVYDSVGRDTFPHSLDCLKKRGMWVLFGQSSGLIEDFNMQDLARHGSLFATRPLLFDYIEARQELVSAAEDLFGAIRSGAVKAAINQRFPLEDAASAHRQLEARQTTGSTILLP